MIWNADPKKDWNYIKSQLDCIYILLDYTSLKNENSKSVIEVRKENLYQAIQSLYYSDRIYQKKKILERLADFQIFSRLYRLNYYTGKPTYPVNLLKETYNIHFKQLSEYIDDKLNNEKIHFEFMMVQYFSFSEQSSTMFGNYKKR